MKSGTRGLQQSKEVRLGVCLREWEHTDCDDVTLSQRSEPVGMVHQQNKHARRRMRKKNQSSVLRSDAPGRDPFVGRARPLIPPADAALPV